MLFVVSAWGTVTNVAFIKAQGLWTQTVDDIKHFELTYTRMLADAKLSQVAFLDEIKNFEDAGDQQRGTIHAMRTLRHTLIKQLERQDQQLKQIEVQREAANRLISTFEASISETESLLGNAVTEKLDLKKRLDAAESQLAEISQQRDAGERIEMGLRWRLTKLEGELQEKQNEGAQVWLKDWALGRAEALEELFTQTGMDLNLLITRAGEIELGQGGPFQLAGTEAGDAKPADEITNEIQRLVALQTLARSLPLGAPLDHYSLTSSFGKRSDPITGELAFHGGLDFGAAPNSKIRATSPGRVIHAGPLGPYGVTVEIDHGMGITTRFGHLKKASVEVGQDISFRDVIGVIGSTGRSTGRHLHYEIRLDGEAYDPAKFLDTGRNLIWAFGTDQS
ncbi:MAG: peptidoglycan DD-metalloendopeptidase family protein [Alphaproteobacteria bacterium]|nr:peptidoglycan DD-metalloendopeptidase family protein [Alphaproteobacteria bacterium]